MQVDNYAVENRTILFLGVGLGPGEMGRFGLLSFSDVDLRNVDFSGENILDFQTSHQSTFAWKPLETMQAAD